MPLSQTLYKHAQFAHPGLQIVAGNFTMNGSGEPDAAEGKPFRESGLDLDRTGQGLYTLTVPGRGGIEVLANFFFLEDSATDMNVRLLSKSETARTFALGFYAYDADGVPVATDPTDAAKLSVLILLKGRSI